MEMKKRSLIETGIFGGKLSRIMDKGNEEGVSIAGVRNRWKND